MNTEKTEQPEHIESVSVEILKPEMNPYAVLYDPIKYLSDKPLTLEFP